MADYILTDDELADLSRAGFRLKTVLAAQVEKVLRLVKQKATKTRAAQRKKKR